MADSKHPAVVFYDEIEKQIDWSRIWETLKEYKGHHTQIGRIEDESSDGTLIVTISCDSDSWVETIRSPDSDHLGGALRFRTNAGGGNSLRVQTALILLAVAMAADNAESPISNPHLE